MFNPFSGKIKTATDILNTYLLKQRTIMDRAQSALEAGDVESTLHLLIEVIEAQTDAIINARNTLTQ